MEKSGIYQISVQNKKYIGSSANIPKRWKWHKDFLDKQEHHNRFLQNLYNKYPSEIKFEILATCPPEYNLKLEQKFIDMLNPEINIVKDVTSGGFSLTRKFDDEEIIKIFESYEKERNTYKVAEKFDCNAETIRGIINKDYYNHVDVPKQLVESCKDLSRRWNQEKLIELFEGLCSGRFKNIRQAALHYDYDVSGMYKIVKRKKYAKVHIPKHLLDCINH